MERWNTFGNAAFCTEYDDDILETLKESELRRKVPARCFSPQHDHRQSLVNLIRRTSEALSFQRTTIHLAMYLLDVFMASHSIPELSLKLVALTCLYVSSKVEENESNIPSPKKLNEFADNVYLTADFIEFEIMVLTFFDWHLTVPTAATFLDLFTMHSRKMDDSKAAKIHGENGSSPTGGTLGERVVAKSMQMLDMTLNHSEMCKVRPSMLAASCLSIARFLMPDTLAWNDEMTSVTGYEYSEVHELCLRLLFLENPQLFSSVCTDTTPKKAGCESGYLSDGDKLCVNHSHIETEPTNNDTSCEDSDNGSFSYSTCCTCHRDSDTEDSNEDADEEERAKRRRVA